MRRVVCVWLPEWPIERLRRASPRLPVPPASDEGEGQEPPLVLVAGGPRGLRVMAANRAAREAGAAAGMAHADALATVPGLLALPAEPEADARALLALARWCTRRHTPVANVDGEDGLVLDVTGCAGLFGGDEAALLLDLGRRLARWRLTAKAALSDSWGASWALARFARARTVIVPPGGQREALAPLPVAALRLDDATVALLRRLGLVRIGDLHAFPREALARRFGHSFAEGTAVLLRLDQALGRRPEPVAPLEPEPDYREELAPPEPLLDLAGVEAGLRLLLGRLAERLERDGRGARRLVLEAVRADGRRPAAEVRTSRPARDPGHLMRLFAERLPAAVDPGFGVELLVLTAPETEPTPPKQAGLAGEDGRDGTAEDLARLIDRLGARLGEGAVWRPAPLESHIPERSETARPATLADAGASVWPAVGEMGGGPSRPLRLLGRPEPVAATAEVPDGPPAGFTWRRVRRRVTRARGPERIAPEWWLAPEGRAGPTRDYYEVEDEDGRRYWLFRSGLYGEGDAAPAWFLHGLFA